MTLRGEKNFKLTRSVGERTGIAKDLIKILKDAHQEIPLELEDWVGYGGGGGRGAFYPPPPPPFFLRRWLMLRFFFFMNPRLPRRRREAVVNQEVERCLRRRARAESEPAGDAAGGVFLLVFA